MYATLMDERGERELNTLSDKKARTMTGSVVASLAHLKDVNGNDGAFFVFPDLSVRCEGVYRLKFSLFEIVGNQVFFCKSITSTMFTVYSAKKFPGMDESTRLTKLFAEQGLKIRVRKEQKSVRPKGNRSRLVSTAMHSDAVSPSHMSPWGASASAPFAQHHDHHDPRDYHDYHDQRDHDYHDPRDHRLQPQMLPQMHPQARPAPPSAWGSTHMRQALDPARAALSQSPQPARYQGHSHYQLPLHDSLRKPLPSYSHPASSSMSSPNPVSMAASAPQALQPHARAQALPLPPQPSQLHHGQPPADYFEAPYPQMLPPAHTFPAYRPPHMAEDGRPPLQQQQHFGQHRPWSPHHRAQVQSHHSPAHVAISFVNESRYSPYTRQPDAVRDPRHRMSPSVRIGSTVVPPAQDAAQQQQHYYQPPTRHQQRPLHFSVVTSSSAPETPSASTLVPAAAVAHAHASRLG
ncbi:hypothetical protein LPJ66_002389, partial [Kickxella alabastrina]